LDTLGSADEKVLLFCLRQGSARLQFAFPRRGSLYS
jgi:hypothetical protein